MSFARIKENFLALPKQIKLIGIGSLILGISTLLPWYADLDSYKIGDEFLGVTGPASFVGIVILLLAGFSLWVFSYHVRGRKTPKLPVREAIAHLFVSIESLFLLVLVNSIYFHPKFGVNITLKESRFGMIIAFAGALVLLMGAFWQNREEIRRGDEVGKLEPLIKLEPTIGHSAQVPLKSEPPAYARPHVPVKSPVAPSEFPRRIFPHAKETTRGFLFGEAASAEKPKKDDSGHSTPGDGSYMLRMDR